MNMNMMFDALMLGTFFGGIYLLVLMLLDHISAESVKKYKESLRTEKMEESIDQLDDRLSYLECTVRSYLENTVRKGDRK